MGGRHPTSTASACACCRTRRLPPYSGSGGDIATVFLRAISDCARMRSDTLSGTTGFGYVGTVHIRLSIRDGPPPLRLLMSRQQLRVRLPNSAVHLVTRTMTDFMMCHTKSVLCALSRLCSILQRRIMNKRRAVKQLVAFCQHFVAGDGPGPAGWACKMTNYLHRVKRAQQFIRAYASCRRARLEVRVPSAQRQSTLRSVFGSPRLTPLFRHEYSFQRGVKLSIALRYLLACFVCGASAILQLLRRWWTKVHYARGEKEFGKPPPLRRTASRAKNGRLTDASRFTARLRMSVALSTTASFAAKTSPQHGGLSIVAPGGNATSPGAATQGRDTASHVTASASGASQQTPTRSNSHSASPTPAVGGSSRRSSVKYSKAASRAGSNKPLTAEKGKSKAKGKGKGKPKSTGKGKAKGKSKTRKGSKAAPDAMSPGLGAGATSSGTAQLDDTFNNRSSISSPSVSKRRGGRRSSIKPRRRASIKGAQGSVITLLQRAPAPEPAPAPAPPTPEQLEKQWRRDVFIYGMTYEQRQYVASDLSCCCGGREVVSGLCGWCGD